MEYKTLRCATKNFLTAMGVFICVHAGSLSAGAVEVSGGLDWIVSQQRADGSWNGRVRDGIEILKVMRHFGRDNTASFNSGVRWLNGISADKQKRKGVIP